MIIATGVMRLDSIRGFLTRGKILIDISWEEGLISRAQDNVDDLLVVQGIKF